MRRMDPGLKPASTTDAAAKPSPYDGGTLQQWAPTACSKYTADLQTTARHPDHPLRVTDHPDHSPTCKSLPSWSDGYVRSFMVEKTILHAYK